MVNVDRVCFMKEEEEKKEEEEEEEEEGSKLLNYKIVTCITEISSRNKQHAIGMQNTMHVYEKTEINI